MNKYKSAVAFFSILIALSCGRPDASGSPDIEHYEITAEYQPGKGIALAMEVAILNKDGNQDINLKFARDAVIDSLKLRAAGQWYEAVYTRGEGNDFKITVPERPQDVNELTLAIKYLYPAADSIDRYLYIDRGYNWYPMITDDVATVKLEARLPIGFEMFTGGDLLSKTSDNDHDLYVWETKIPVFKIPFVIVKAGQYREMTKVADGKYLYYYYLTGDSLSNSKIVDETGRMMNYLSQNIGPYHHEQLRLVELPDFQGSIIGTGIVLTGDDFLNQYRTHIYTGLHLTIAAQWFGSGVFGKFRDKGFWFFSLALPHYVRMMYLENSTGKDVFESELESQYAAYKNAVAGGTDIPILAVDMLDSKEKGAVIYGKGPMVLHRLRLSMGDDNWNEFLRDIYAEYCGKIITYDAFTGYVQKYGGADLASRFKGMMETTGEI